MSAARVLAMGTLAASIGLAAMALAQPHGKPPRGGAKPKPSSAAPENPYDDKGAPPGASSAEAHAPPAGSGVPGATDAGSAPVPPPASEGFDGGKLSPLNPAANEFSDAGALAPPVDYDALLADIAALRARVAAVSDTLFRSRMTIALETSGDRTRLAGLTVSLDDGIVWTSPAGFRGDEPSVVYDHAVAPGRHAVTVEAERRDDANDGFRSAQRSRFVVEVPADGKLSVEVKLSDESNMGADFPGKKEGQYDLRIRMRAKGQALSR